MAMMLMMGAVVATVVARIIMLMMVQTVMMKKVKQRFICTIMKHLLFQQSHHGWHQSAIIYSQLKCKHVSGELKRERYIVNGAKLQSRCKQIFVATCNGLN